MDETIKLKYKDKNATMQVLCRDDDGLVVQILNNVDNDQTGRDAHQTNKSQLTDLKLNQSKDNADIYLVKIQETENMFSQKIVYIVSIRKTGLVNQKHCYAFPIYGFISDEFVFG